MPGWLEKRLRNWALFSIRRPKAILAIAAIVFAISIAGASRLGLRSDFIELLPTDSPSVVNLERLKKRVVSFQTLTVALECPDDKAMIRFSEDLVARLSAFPDSQIKFIDYTITPIREFYEKNKLLFADLKDIEDFRDRLSARIKEETRDAFIEDLSDEPRPKTDLQIDKLKEKYQDKAKTAESFPDGYYLDKDRKLQAIMIRPPSQDWSFEKSERLVADVQAVLEELDPKSYHPELTWGFTGDVKTGIDEREALAADMKFISILCLVLILGVIILYYRSLRSVILIGTPMLLGLSSALGITWLTIGYLNTATAFLASIVAGNGINYMIMLSARWFEETKRHGPSSLELTLPISVVGTFSGTLVASAAAGVAYGSLIFAGFRGFRQFGIIGGIGMLLCWLATFLVGPALITVLNRAKPFVTAKKEEKHRIATALASFINRWPKAILVGAGIVSVLSVVAIIPYSANPFEYDFRNLRNKFSKEQGAAKLSNRVDNIFPLPALPVPVVIDSPESAPRVKQVLLSRPGREALIHDVKALSDHIPDNQDAKIVVINDIRKLLDSKLDFLSPSERAEIEKYRPADDLKAISIEDLPEPVARMFTEVDGTRGRVLYIYAAKGNSLLNGRFLLKFADFVRSTEVPGAEMTVVGNPMVFADMIAAILHDGVIVTIAATIGVILLLGLAFRSVTGIFAVTLSVLLGTLWMIGVAGFFDIKLNFLNFVVIPITLGIGADYGANILSRYRAEGPGRIGDVLKSTGGAVMLSSLTTIIGYGTLITSMNMALRSFGIVADVGEFTCIIAAEIVMTALLVLFDRRKLGKMSDTTRS